MLLEASTSLWNTAKLKYYFLTIYSDLLSKVHPFQSPTFTIGSTSQTYLRLLTFM